MKPDRFKRLKKLPLEAVDLPEAERKTYLSSACKDDPDLRQEVESIPASGADPSEVLETIDIVPETLLMPEPESHPMPDQIADYRIIKKLGEGGMSVSRQKLPGQKVLEIKRYFG
jgi:hypothetical protein